MQSLEGKELRAAGEKHDEGAFVYTVQWKSSRGERGNSGGVGGGEDDRSIRGEKLRRSGHYSSFVCKLADRSGGKHLNQQREGRGGTFWENVRLKRQYGCNLLVTKKHGGVTEGKTKDCIEERESRKGKGSSGNEWKKGGLRPLTQLWL